MCSPPFTHEGSRSGRLPGRGSDSRCRTPRDDRAEHVREEAVVVDVGIHRRDKGGLVGDVRFDEVKPRASYITPIPGGVGPMTRAMLLYNAVRAAEDAGTG